MVRSLFDLCLASICHRNLVYDADMALLPCDCKQRLMEFFASHDQINTELCFGLMSRPMFGRNLTRLCFYLSEQLNDSILEALTRFNQSLRFISLIECPLVTDAGIINVTLRQSKLVCLELVGLPLLTSNSLKVVKSSRLRSVDLSGCRKISSEGIFYLVFNNPSIVSLCLNGCQGLDEQALYDIARGIGVRLFRLELDQLHNSNMAEHTKAISSLSRQCPNIARLSLCQFFPALEEDETEQQQQCLIEGTGLRDVDLYGNLQLQCLEEDANSIERANSFLCQFIPYMGAKITRLHITVQRLVDSAFLVLSQIPSLSHLALDVAFLNAHKRANSFLCQVTPYMGAKITRLHGVINVTLRQSKLVCLELVGLPLLTSNSLKAVKSSRLRSVDLSGCRKVGKGIVGCRFSTTFAALVFVLLFSGSCGQTSETENVVNTPPAFDRDAIENSIQNKLSSELWYINYLAIAIVIVVVCVVIGVGLLCVPAILDIFCLRRGIKDVKARVTTIEADITKLVGEIKGVETKVIADIIRVNEAMVAANKADLKELKNEIVRVMGPLQGQMASVAATDEAMRSRSQLLNNEIVDAMTAIRVVLERRK